MPGLIHSNPQTNTLICFIIIFRILSRWVILDGLFRVKIPCDRGTEEEDGRAEESTVSDERRLGGGEGTGRES
jgi:hypothetical protein